MKMDRAVLFVVFLSVVAGWLGPGPVRAAIYNEVRLTHNSYDDRYPWIGGNYIVWQGRDMLDSEIYCYDVLTGETVRITDNDLDDLYPITDGQHLLWTRMEELGELEYRYSLYLRDLGTGETVQLSGDARLTTGAMQFVQPGSLLDDGVVVWIEEGASSNEVFVYDASTGETTQITENGDEEQHPVVNQGRVAWITYIAGTPYVSKVHLYDLSSGETSEVCSVENTHIYAVNLRGEHIAWTQDAEEDRHQVFLHDLSSGETDPLSDAEASSGYPWFAENGILWMELDPEGFARLYSLDFSSGETTLILDSHESGWIEWPYIDGNDVVWGAQLDVGKDIFHYDLSTGETTRVTQDVFTDEFPKVHEGRIVWHGYDLPSDHYEIYMGVPCLDRDGDGYEDASCGGTDCNDSDPDVNPGMGEIPENGIDDDCDPLTPAYPEPANTLAASYGGDCLLGSGMFNTLIILLLPVGAVVLLRRMGRRPDADPF